MKSNLRNEIKSYIVRQGMTMQEIVDLLRDEHGWSDSVSNLYKASLATRYCALDEHEVSVSVCLY